MSIRLASSGKDSTSTDDSSIVLGWTFSRRILSVILGQVPNLPDVYYVFSARPASRSERTIHASQRGMTNDESGQAHR